ncbi:BamA/TamA family outer membrane protein [candidate division KSB1 bacterium]|nr:BamA/TamA family outer membrane protein [candidate division KSB1 bacterium]
MQNLYAGSDSTSFRIRTIRYHGNSRFSQQDLQSAFSENVSSAVDSSVVDKLMRNILQRYREDGGHFTAIDSLIIVLDDKAAHSDIDVYIDEVNAIRLDSIIIHAADENLARRLNAIPDYRNRGDMELMVLNTIDHVFGFLEDNGYPHARIDIDSLVMHDHINIKAYLSVDPGPLFTIDKISVSGNEITKDKVIVRESRLKPGTIYNHSEVEKVTNRIKKLGFFSKVYDPKIFINSKGEGELVLYVEEGNMNSFDGVLGYNPGGTNEKGFFTGLVDIALANFMGTGRRVEAYWEKKTQKTQQLRFRYQEPWVMGYPLHIGGSFEQLVQDTTFIRRNWKFDFQVPLSETIRIFADVGNESISPDSLGSVLWQIPKSNSQFATAGIAFDTRDDLINPSRGIYYVTEVEVARKKIGATEYIVNPIERGSFTRRKMSMDVELFVPTFKWQVISLGFHGQQVTSDEETLSISDMFRFGGSNTLRGFREDEFIGERVAWLNTEYRYLLSERSRAFIFFDSGYFFRKDINKVEKEDVKFGYGFGIRLDTRLGLMGLDYGLAKGRSLSNGLIHVRLINEF